MHRADFHLHSHLSPDAVPSMDALARAASEKGIQEIAITDHYDLMEQSSRTAWSFKTKEYFEEIKKTRAAHGEKIALRAGVEIAQPHISPEYARKFIRENEFDFVLGSLHNLKNDVEAHILPRERYRAPEGLFREYFEELEKTILWGEFDSLAHITYPERFVFAETGARVDFSLFEKELSHLLSLLIRMEKGLEVNTAGLRRPLSKLSADEYILGLYQKLGGRILTIGSDAHEAKDLGAGFFDAVSAAKKAGFTEYATFEKRKMKLWKM